MKTKILIIIFLTLTLGFAQIVRPDKLSRYDIRELIEEYDEQDLYDKKNFLMYFGAAHSSFDLLLSVVNSSTSENNNFKAVIPPLVFGFEGRIHRHFSLGIEGYYAQYKLTSIEISQTTLRARANAHFPFLGFVDYYLGIGFDIHHLGIKKIGDIDGLSGPLKDFIDQSADDLLVNNGLFGLGLSAYNWSLQTGFRFDIVEFFGVFIEGGFPNLLVGGVHFRF